MIVIKVSGGLGNQMFQYAFARALQSRRRVEVKIDASCFALSKRNVTEREFLLGQFDIKLPIATAEDFRKIGVPFPPDRTLAGNLNRLAFKIKERLRSDGKKKILSFHELTFTEDAFDISDNTYVSGVWTNQNYFVAIRDQILNDFSLRENPSPATHKIAALIGEKNAVSVHVRRGDYLKYAHKFKILSEEYYAAAVRCISEKTRAPAFFVFSDDIEYVEKNYADLFGANTTYVSNEKLADHEEMWLMSRCPHNIIANSTFSWWAAWLNQNPDKIVIAPKEYRNDDKAIDDLFPHEWITM